MSRRSASASGPASGSGSGASNSSRAVTVCESLEQSVPKRVLEEEEFVSSLERLIRRDYFPSMLSEEDKVLVPKVSLSEYLANHTSEDSASFDEIVQSMKEEQRKAFYWIDAEAESKRKAELRAQQGQLILSKEYRDDDRPKCIDTNKYVTRNQLMFFPESRGKEPRHSSLNRVNLSSTRFPVAGVDLASDTSSVTASTEAAAGSTPRIKGYKLLRAPSPKPEQLQTPLVTWGKLMATPTRIDQDDEKRDPQHGFYVPTVPEREATARRLGDKASRRIAKRKRDAIQLPSSKALQSPAAKMLLSRARSELHSDLRASYSGTPTPSSNSQRRRTTDRSATPLLTPLPLTPRSSTARKQAGAAGAAASLTDGLLDV